MIAFFLSFSNLVASHALLAEEVTKRMESSLPAGHTATENVCISSGRSPLIPKNGSIATIMWFSQCNKL